MGLLLVVGAAIILGMQYVDPDKRMVQIIVAAIIVGIAWYLDTLSGLCLLVLALPYPRGTSFGSTNVAFILLLLLIWLLRIAQKRVAPPRRTPLDLPIAGLVLAYVVSFNSIAKTAHLQPALLNTTLFIACLALFYMIVNNVHSSAGLERLLNFQAISCASCCLIAVWEMNHPGQWLIPGWIAFEGGQGSDLIHRVRVGGPFFDYEELSDYCAISLVMVAFLFLRARSQSRRWIFGGLWLLVLLVQFATVTRGGIIAAGMGFVYLLWLLRRRIHFVKLVTAVGIVVSAGLAMGYYVANYTRTGDLLSRLGGTKFVGLIPESRVGVWDTAFNRWLQHPLFGMGPHYSLEKGLSFWVWPHNVYLFIANIVGAFGLFFFLLLLWRLWKITLPRVDDVFHPSLATGFLAFGHIMLFVFMVDQFKIDYLRNPIYQFQVWVFFAILAAAHRVSLLEARPAARTLPRAA